jgi:hypothetical protein
LYFYFNLGKGHQKRIHQRIRELIIDSLVMISKINSSSEKKCKGHIIIKYRSMLMSTNKDPTELCSCKCHYGGAVSCPGCKDKHGIVCCHCKD